MRFAGPAFARPVLAAVALVAALTAPLAAREATDAEKQQLTETVSAFDAATIANDIETVVKTIPPKVLAAMASQFGMDVAQLEAAVIEQSKIALAAVTLVSFKMDLDAASFAEGSDGEPYALIPTETVMEVNGGKVRAASDTLAILDEGTWYLVRIDDPAQVQILKQVYPGLAEAEFKPGTMEAVTE